MKIAILGTKGIPNNYGGYEQFAEFISTRLVDRGHSVTVYNPSFHNFKENSFKGVSIKSVFSPEKWLGGAANIIYDHLCLQDALANDFDIIYEAGYHSVALSLKFFNVKNRKNPVVITNMDGLEWKRTKWSKTVQNIIKGLEKIAVTESPFLISDNLGIKAYLQERFGKSSFYIPYGADPVEAFDVGYLSEYRLTPGNYFILVARLEPENNIETILLGHRKADRRVPIIVVGNNNSNYGRYLCKNFEQADVRFVGGIYEKPRLDALRHFSKAYFHGHSVGGTNPSLLEAMACQCFIWAHQNPFNRSVLEGSALYFDDVDDVAKLVQNGDSLRNANYSHFREENSSKIGELYNWDVVVSQHETLFKDLLSA